MDHGKNCHLKILKRNNYSYDGWGRQLGVTIIHIRTDRITILHIGKNRATFPYMTKDSVTIHKMGNIIPNLT